MSAVRKMAVILAGDVVGFSRLVGAREEATLARYKAARAELIDPAIAEHRGRLFKTTGDGFLAEFASAVDALRCALAIQAGMRRREEDLREDRRIVLRLGINLGDVVVEGNDLLGDGVNVAARIETLCRPGGVFVSRAARDQALGKLAIDAPSRGLRASRSKAAVRSSM